MRFPESKGSERSLLRLRERPGGMYRRLGPVDPRPDKVVFRAWSRFAEWPCRWPFRMLAMQYCIGGILASGVHARVHGQRHWWCIGEPACHAEGDHDWP